MSSQTDQADAEANPPHQSDGKSTVEPVMKRGEARLFAVLCFAVSVFLLHGPARGLLNYFGAALGVACGLVFGVCALFPARSQSGVVLFDGGFEHFAGLHGRQLVHFGEIDKIVAVQTGGGAEGDEVLLEIFCGNTKVRLGEGDLFGTDLHRILFELPGFQREQYAIAAQYQLKGLEHFKCKRFKVFEKSMAKV